MGSRGALVGGPALFRFPEDTRHRAGLSKIRSGGARKARMGPSVAKSNQGREGRTETATIVPSLSCSALLAQTVVCPEGVGEEGATASEGGSGATPVSTYSPVPSELVM